MRRVRPAKVYRCAHDGAAARRGRGECEVPPLEIEVQAIQLSPYRAGLAGHHPTRLPMAPASPTCSCPLWLSLSGKSDDPEASLRTSPDCVRDSAPRPAAHSFPSPGSSAMRPLSWAPFGCLQPPSGLVTCGFAPPPCGASLPHAVAWV